MSCKPVSIILAVTLILFGAAQARAVTYYWDGDNTAAGNDPLTGAGLGGTGVWSTTATPLDWYNGTTDVAWPNTQSPRVDAAFIGTAGTVSSPTGVNLTLYVGDVKVEPSSGNYTISIRTGSSGSFHFYSFSGAGLSSTTWQGPTSDQYWYADGASPTTVYGTMSFSGPWHKFGAGTLTLNLVSSNANLYNASGSLLLAGTWSTGSTDINDCGSTAAALSVLGGTGTISAKGVYVYRAGQSGGAGCIYPGIMSPGGDPAAAAYSGGSHVAGGNPIATHGVGVLTLNLANGSAPNRQLGLYGSTAGYPDCASILLMDIKGNAGPGLSNGYDQVVVTGSGNSQAQGWVHLDCGTGNTVGAKLCLNWNKAGYAGSRGDFLKLINVNSATSGLIKENFSYPDTGATINDGDCVLFTNAAGKGFLFTYRYNFDVSGTQNDFGLYDNVVITTSAGGAYTIGAADQALGGSAVIDSNVAGDAIAGWAWDFNLDCVTDLTGQNPTVNLAYFTGAFGWAADSTHTILLTTTDTNGVVSWGATDLTLEGAVPEPATWALLGTGLLVGVALLRRRRMK